MLGQGQGLPARVHELVVEVLLLGGMKAGVAGIYRHGGAAGVELHGVVAVHRVVVGGRGGLALGVQSGVGKLLAQARVGGAGAQGRVVQGVEVGHQPGAGFWPRFHIELRFGVVVAGGGHGAGVRFQVQGLGAARLALGGVLGDVLERPGAAQKIAAVQVKKLLLDVDHRAAAVAGVLALAPAQGEVGVPAGGLALLGAQVENAGVALGIVLGRRRGDDFQGLNAFGRHVAQHVQQRLLAQAHGPVVNQHQHAAFALHGDVVGAGHRHPRCAFDDIESRAARHGRHPVDVHHGAVELPLHHGRAARHLHFAQLPGRGPQHQRRQLPGIGLQLHHGRVPVLVAQLLHAQPVGTRHHICKQKQALPVALGHLHEAGIGGLQKQHVGKFQRQARCIAQAAAQAGPAQRIGRRHWEILGTQ